MYKILLIMILFTVFSIPLASAQTNSEKIIQECEYLYPELETLGKSKFLQRYMYHPNIRVCLTLYNDLNWSSDNLDRTEKLIALLGEPIIKKPIRDRFEQTVDIPQWIKDDVTRWHQGKELDNVFSYGIKFMINSKIIDVPIASGDQTGCISDQICVSKNNYIKYSIKDNQNKDVRNLTHTFDTFGTTISISSTETTKTGKQQDVFHIDSNGLVDHTEQYYRFVHKIPIEPGMKVDSEYELKAVSQVLFPFKNQQRDAIIAWDKTRQYQEVIDKNTGIVLFIKHQDRIKKTEWIAQLADTNAFSERIIIHYEDMQIPSWVQGTAKWWTEGKISDSEYIAGITYLLKNNIMRV